MEDLGAPISWVVLEHGAAVYSSDGERIGEVDEVRAAQDKDIFEGLVIRGHLLSLSRRYVAADAVDEIYENGVVLTLDEAACASLPEPD